MQEIWKDVKGYEGCYQVSNLGRVKSLNYLQKGKEQILRLEKTPKNYFRCAFSKDGKVKRYSVHRLVAQAFIPNPYNLPIINHKDENPSNNRVENLEWCDSKYNNNYGTHIQKIANKVRNHPNMSKKVLCIETGVIYQSTHQAERELGYSRGFVSHCCRDVNKTCGGFHWRYID